MNSGQKEFLIGGASLIWAVVGGSLLFFGSCTRNESDILIGAWMTGITFLGWALFMYFVVLGDRE